MTKKVQRLEAESPLVVKLSSPQPGFALVGTSGVDVCCSRGAMMDEDDVYGDEWVRKEEDELVCVCLNVNGLSKDIWKEKNDSLRNFMHHMKSDVIVLQEVNLRWDILPHNEQWLERSKGWWEGGQCASISYNATDIISSATQLGGCIATCSGQAKRRMVQRGREENWPLGLD